MAAEKKPEDAPPEPSRTAGGCVLVVLAVVVIAGVFAVSPVAGVLTVWVVGVAAVYRSARRVSDSSATPPLLSDTPSGDVFAADTPRVARVERSPEGVMCIVHLVQEEVGDRRHDA